MKLIILFGPPAVGKMTVGVELAKQTGLKLFHNHMTIDLVLNFFDWSSPQFKLSDEFRYRIFEEVASSDLDGLIFTYVWALNVEGDRRYIEKICALFAANSADIYFVELEADLHTRLARNETDFRLQQKPSKRNITQSKQNILDCDQNYKLNSNNDFYHQKNYLHIDNSSKEAVDVASEIVEFFGL